MEVSTVSGNWSMVITANDFPYAYLLSSKDDDNIHGFCAYIYMISMLITRDQGLVNDLDKAVKKYEKRLEKSEKVVEDETEEKIALEEVKAVQELVEMPKKERRKVVRDINGRFAKAVKNVEK